MFKGTVKIGGEDAPVGTIISAEIEGGVVKTNAPAGIPTAGYYQLPIPNNGYIGKTVKLYVDGDFGGQGTYPDPFLTPYVIVNLSVAGVVRYSLILSSTVGGEVTRPGEGTFPYDEGIVVRLTATPDKCYEFDEWTGEVADVADVHDSSTTVTMNGDYEIVAEFVPIPPYLVVNKSVSPSTIGQKGSGLKPEEARVTLTVSGVCDPEGYLTDIVVTDVLQSYITLEDGFTIEPDIETADGTTTLVWDVGELDTTGEWTVSFDISSDKCGRVLVDVVDESKVTYNIAEDMFGYSSVVIGTEAVSFPATYLNVRCPREVVVGVLPPEPAKIGASYLYISPEQIVPSQWVEISANIYNRGGTKATHTVALYINGYLAQSQTVGVSPGGTELVVFRVRADSEFLGGIYTGPGEYIANVEGMVGQFFVLAPAAAAPAAFGGPLGTGGIIAIVVIVIVLIVGLVFGLRRE